MKKTYEVQLLPTAWSCQIEIDHDFPKLMEGVKEMVDFWTGGKARLEEFDGDYLKAFLVQLGEDVFRILNERNLNVYGVVDAFKDREGYCKMDGSFGIKIVATDSVSYLPSEFWIEEVEPAV